MASPPTKQAFGQTARQSQFLKFDRYPSEWLHLRIIISQVQDIFETILSHFSLSLTPNQHHINTETHVKNKKNSRTFSYKKKSYSYNVLFMSYMFNIKLNEIQYKPKKLFLRFKYKEMSFKFYPSFSHLQGFILGEYII